MNLALSASQLFRRYLNEAYAVTRQDHSSLGRLMVTVSAIGLVQVLALPIVARRARDAGARPESPHAPQRRADARQSMETSRPGGDVSCHRGWSGTDQCDTADTS